MLRNGGPKLWGGSLPRRLLDGQAFQGEQAVPMKKVPLGESGAPPCPAAARLISVKYHHQHVIPLLKSPPIPGLPQWLSKESTCHAGGRGSICGSGKSPGEGNGNPFQYSRLGNPTDRGALLATVHGVTRVRHD